MKNIKMLVAILSMISISACYSEAFVDPPAEMASLQRIVGGWRGNGLLTAPGEQHAVEASWTCKEELDGYAVSCTLETDAYRAIHVFSFDVFSGTYSWSLACTDSLVLSFTGDLVDNTFLFRDGERAYATLRFIDDNNVELAVGVRFPAFDGHASYRMTRR